jgi:hypothetical protein
MDLAQLKDCPKLLLVPFELAAGDTIEVDLNRIAPRRSGRGVMLGQGRRHR